METLQKLFDYTLAMFNEINHCKIKVKVDFRHTEQVFPDCYFSTDGKTVFIESELLTPMSWVYILMFEICSCVDENRNDNGGITVIPDKEPEWLLCGQDVASIFYNTLVTYTCKPIPQSVLDVIWKRLKQNDLMNLPSIGLELAYASIAFGILHELAHIYDDCYHADDVFKTSLQLELTVDDIANRTFLRIADSIMKGSDCDDLMKNCFDGLYYLAPAALVSFEHVAMLICKEFRLGKEIDSAFFDDMIVRRNALIDYYDKWPDPFDTSEGNKVFGCLEYGIDGFLQYFVSCAKENKFKEYRSRGGFKWND